MMTEEKPSNKRKRPYLLHEMISQSSRVRALDSNQNEINAESDILQVAHEATELIRKINNPQASLSNQPENVNTTLRTTVTTTLSPTVSQSVPQSVARSDSLSVPQSVPQSVTQPTQQSIQHSASLSKQHSLPQSKTIDDPFWSLTDRQAKILTYLINNSSRITKHALISEATNISYLSVRDALYNLTRDGFLKRKVRYRRGSFQGFKYFLDEEKCEIFMRRQSEKTYYCQTPHSLPQSDQQSVSPTLSPTLYTAGTISSSSIFNKTTTKSFEETLYNHPELGYWRQKGLTAKQIEQWMKITGSTLDNMVQSLCHCRFEMVDLDYENSKPVKNVFNWFYRVIERAGFYPAPKGYQSYLDKQIEQEKALLEECEKKLEELRQIQQKKIEQEKELSFREMMANPEGDIYKACFARLNHFAKKSSNAELFEMAMRKVFDELTPAHSPS